MKTEKIAYLAGTVLALAGCGLNPIEYDDTLLDGPVVNDTSFTDPTFLPLILNTLPSASTGPR